MSGRGPRVPRTLGAVDATTNPSHLPEARTGGATLPWAQCAAERVSTLGRLLCELAQLLAILQEGDLSFCRKPKMLPEYYFQINKELLSSCCGHQVLCPMLSPEDNWIITDTSTPHCLLCNGKTGMANMEEGSREEQSSESDLG